MGIFDGFSFDQFAKGAGEGFAKGAKFRSDRAAAKTRGKAQKASDERANQALKLQQDKFKFDRDRIAGADETAAQEKERKLGADLNQALQIQDSVDQARESGALSEQQISQINAAGGGPEQSALLNSLIAGSEEQARAAPLEDAQLQGALAEIEATQARTADLQRGPDAPTDIATLEALGLEPTLENLNRLKQETTISSAGAAPKVLSPGQSLIGPGGDVLFQGEAPEKDEFTTKQKNDASKAEVAFGTVDSALEKLDGLVSKHGAEIGSGKIREEMKQLENTALLEMKELFNLGVLNGSDLEILQSLLVSPTPGALGAAKEGLNTLLSGEGLKERSRASIASLRESAAERRDIVGREGGRTPAVDPASMTPQQRASRLAELRAKAGR